MATTTEFLSKAVLKKQGSLAFAWLADRELEAGNVLVASEILDEGLGKYPESVPGLFIKAKILRQQQKPEDASNILLEVLERDPLHLAAQKVLAQLYVELARGPEAHAMVSKLRELDSLAPDFPAIPESLSVFAPAPASPPVISAAPSEFMIEREQLFASLEDAFLEETVAGDEKSAAELQSELEAALAGTPHVAAEQEYFPADDASLPSGDVSSLFSQMFGKEETKSDVESAAPAELSLPAEELAPEAPVASVAPASIFSSYTPPPPPPVAPEPEPVAATPAQEFEKPAETRNPTGIDLASALDDLFGDDEDELPVENLGTPLSQTATAVAAPALFEKTPEVPTSSSPDLTGGVADALGDMFGLEDELPVEGMEPPGPSAEPQDEAAEAPALSSSLFEKTPEVPPSSSSDLTGGVADALGDMFGLEDELPVEGMEPPGPSTEPQDEAAEAPALSSSLFEKTPEVPTSSSSDLTGGVADALGDMFGLEDELPEESKPAELLSGNLEEKSNSKTDDLTSGVSQALGSMFGSDDEVLDETSRGATTMEELLGGSPVSPAETASSADMVSLQSLADSIYDDAPESPKVEESPENEFRDGVASALGGLFGDFEEDSAERPQEIKPQPNTPQESPFADLLAGDEEAHDEGAVLSGDLAQSLIADPTAPMMETAAEIPVQPAVRVEEESFSGGMSNALTDLFGAELDEDLSDLMEEKKDSSQGSTWTLGELYLEQGHAAEALQVFQELLVADPANEALRQKIAEVQQRISQNGSLDSL